MYRVCWWKREYLSPGCWSSMGFCMLCVLGIGRLLMGQTDAFSHGAAGDSGEVQLDALVGLICSSRQYAMGGLFV